MMSNRMSGYSSSGEVAGEDDIHGSFKQLRSPPLSRRNSDDLTDNDKEYDFDKAMLCIHQELHQLSNELNRKNEKHLQSTQGINENDNNHYNGVRAVPKIEISGCSRSLSKSLPDILTPNDIHTPNRLELAFNQDAAITPKTPFGVNMPIGIAPHPEVDPAGASASGFNTRATQLFSGILGCLRPVLNMIGKNKEMEKKSIDEWEVPFDSIRDLQWLGSGAQGAVFLGKLNGELVAVKKVKDKTGQYILPFILMT